MLRLTALLACLALPAAAADLYECRLKVTHNVVPEIVVIEIGPEGAAVKVNDPVIGHFAGMPIEARVAVDNARRTTFAWELQITTEANQHARIAYRLTVRKPRLSADIHADALGYAGNLTGRGSCIRLAAPARRRGAGT